MGESGSFAVQLQRKKLDSPFHEEESRSSDEKKQRLISSLLTFDELTVLRN